MWRKGICSQVVRDLPFIDSIFGGDFKGFSKGRSVMKLLKNVNFKTYLQLLPHHSSAWEMS